MAVARKSKGVALLEVLASVSVLAFGLGAALEALSICTRTQSRIEEDHTARRLAEERMALLLAGQGGGAPGERSGRFEPPFEAYSWSSGVRESLGESPFRRVELRVWKGAAEGRRLVYTLRTLSL